MVGENIEIYFSQMAKNDLKFNPPWLEKIIKFHSLKWLKMILNYVQKNILGQNKKLS